VILVLRALGIGDLCAAVPALRALRCAYPDEELVLAAPRWLAPLADLTGAVDRLVPVADLSPRTWRLPRPRLAVNLHGRGPESHRLLARAEPGRLLGFACPAADHLDGPQWRREHEVQRWCRMLRWYGLPANPADLSLARSPVRTLALAGAVPVGATVVHPGAKAAERRWPPDRFAAVARALRAAGHDVVITGSTGERPLAAAIARHAGLPGDAVLAGRTDVGQLAALIAHARVVICGDTGAGHLATAFATPSVLLFGPMPPALWGPPGSRSQHRALWHPETMDVGSISTAQVLTAVRQVGERAHAAAAL
jgi:ADP-heptose:LPS heptosyltransferase